jgi:hypothetical protein
MSKSPRYVPVASFGRPWTAGLVLLLLATSCTSFIERRAASSTFSIMEGSKVAMQRSSDTELARIASPGGLVQLEAFHLAYPGHRGFLALLTEGYCQYAVGFVLPDWERSVVAGDRQKSEKLRQRALSLFDKCSSLGLQLLGKNWQEAYAGSTLEARIVAAKKRDVAGMVWLAFGMVNRIALDPFQTRRRAELEVAQALLERVIELDESHNDAIAHLMLGALASSRPRLLGGDPEQGKRHFLRAKELTGDGMLMIDVVFARSYGVTTGNREFFVETLERVTRADPSLWPERRLANALAIEKASVYLRARERFFGNDDQASPDAPPVPAPDVKNAQP